MLTVPTLEGRLVRLEPLGAEHVDDLLAAATEDRSSYGYTHVPEDRNEMESYVAGAQEAQREAKAAPFAVRVGDTGLLVGSTRFLDLEVFVWPPPWPPGAAGPAASDERPPTVVEIGSTWYTASAQGTGVNADCKLAMFTYAFDVWGVLRVTLKTDARNRRSRAAIEALGAVFEGVRRAHVPAVDGTIRDTAFYSVIADEWPAVRTRLRQRLPRG